GSVVSRKLNISELAASSVVCIHCINLSIDSGRLNCIFNSEVSETKGWITSIITITKNTALAAGLLKPSQEAGLFENSTAASIGGTTNMAMLCTSCKYFMKYKGAPPFSTATTGSKPQKGIAINTPISVTSNDETSTRHISRISCKTGCSPAKAPLGMIWYL